MTKELQKVWDFCEIRKNIADSNLDTMGLENMMNPAYQVNHGYSMAYWTVQKMIEELEEEKINNEQ